MKILTVVGARPQFIKAAAVSRAIKNHSEIQETIVHTGQHFDQNMSDIFFNELKIPKPDVNLGINSLGHGAMTGKMLGDIESILIEQKPDWVLVYGDTNSTLAGALAAKKLHIKIAHVEAGLRSFNMDMPEEINRILTDRISDILFCPTENAIKNLQEEGFNNFPSSIELVGDVMKDAALFYESISKEKATIIEDKNLPEKFALATFHRAENTDDKEKLAAIIEALNTVNESVTVVAPIHPRTKIRIDRFDLKPQFTIIDPVGYLDMVQLISNASLVFTDSGGLQKEAYFFEKYCITMREQTEWIELVTNGVNAIVGTDQQKILDQFHKFYNMPFQCGVELYGSGSASDTICNSLLKFEQV